MKKQWEMLIFFNNCSYINIWILKHNNAPALTKFYRVLKISQNGFEEFQMQMKCFFKKILSKNLNLHQKLNSQKS